jgi:hypothetical protein
LLRESLLFVRLYIALEKLASLSSSCLLNRHTDNARDLTVAGHLAMTSKGVLLDEIAESARLWMWFYKILFMETRKYGVYQLCWWTSAKLMGSKTEWLKALPFRYFYAQGVQDISQLV